MCPGVVLGLWEASSVENTVYFCEGQGCGCVACLSVTLTGPELAYSLLKSRIDNSMTHVSSHCTAIIQAVAA